MVPRAALADEVKRECGAAFEKNPNPRLPPQL